MDILEETYDVLEANGLVQNHCEFSVNFLNKSRRYFSMIRASERDASIDALARLAANLKQRTDICRESNFGEVRQRTEFLHPLTQKVWAEFYKQALGRQAV
jgi:hypothetical protein